MDVNSLAEEFALRARSPLWEVTDPRVVAEWVLGDSDDWAGIDALPGASKAVDTARQVWSNPSAGDPIRPTALGVMGWVARMAVPEAAATAGRNWLITVRGSQSTPRVRLTVGMPEVATVDWGDHSLGLWLRIAASPIEDGLTSGELSAAGIKDHEIEREPRVPYKTWAQDAAVYWCPSFDAAVWFLHQAPVRKAARLMCSRLVLDRTRSPHVENYDPAIAAECWAAAEVLLDDDANGMDRGFDRPYRGRPRESDYPSAVQAVNAAAHEAAAAEHHALCLRLIAHLATQGVGVGELIDSAADLAWQGPGGSQMIAEVKSCLGVDDTMQMRLGLGQVLQYRQELTRRRITSGAVLLVSRVPDPLWYDVCAAVGVRLLGGDNEAAWEVSPPA